MIQMDSDYLVSVAIPRPIDHFFTYRISKEWADRTKIGSWVRVPFGRTVTHAYVIEEPKSVQESQEDFPLAKIKNVLEVCDPSSVLPEDVVRLCRWASDYYFAPLGEVLQA